MAEIGKQILRCIHCGATAEANVAVVGTWVKRDGSMYCPKCVTEVLSEFPKYEPSGMMGKHWGSR